MGTRRVAAATEWTPRREGWCAPHGCGARSSASTLEAAISLGRRTRPRTRAGRQPTRSSKTVSWRGDQSSGAASFWGGGSVDRPRSRYRGWGPRRRCPSQWARKSSDYRTTDPTYDRVVVKRDQPGSTDVCRSRPKTASNSRRSTISAASSIRRGRRKPTTALPRPSIRVSDSEQCCGSTLPFGATRRPSSLCAEARVNRRGLAEDAVAETFAVAWRRVDHLPEPDVALPWLLAIARRVLANQHRGRCVGCASASGCAPTRRNPKRTVPGKHPHSRPSIACSRTTRNSYDYSSGKVSVRPRPGWS